MISNMHLKDIKGVASANKSKKKRIKTNIHIQRTCLTKFAIRGTYRTNYTTFPINR